MTIENSLSTLMSLSDLIEDAGFIPVLMKDGLEAVDTLKSKNINAVLTDLEMPRMDGLELARHIRSGDPPQATCIYDYITHNEKHKKSSESGWCHAVHH